MQFAAACSDLDPVAAAGAVDRLGHRSSAPDRFPLASAEIAQIRFPLVKPPA